MRVPVIAGNWKMHKSGEDAVSLARAIRTGIADGTHCQVALAPPFTALAAVAEEIQGTPLILAAQNVHWEPKGAYTGEISVPMLEDVGCGMVILGHSERRQYFGETDETVNRRVRAVLNSTLQPIVCIGETLAEREAGKHHSVIAQQLAGGLDGLTGKGSLAYYSRLRTGLGNRNRAYCVARNRSGNAWLASAIGFPRNSGTRRRKFAFYMAAASSLIISMP